MTAKLRVLTLHQPYATLVALGIKLIETRSNRTNVRGRIAIHAAKRQPVDGLLGDFVIRNGVIHDLGKLCAPLPLGAIVATANLVDCVPIHEQGCSCGSRSDPYISSGVGGLGRTVLGLFDADGRGICSTNANAEDHPWMKARWRHACEHRTGWEMTDELPYGDYSDGRFGWLLEDVEPLAEPVPFAGGQGWSKSWSPS